MKLYERTSCWLTGKKDLELIRCFENFPVHMLKNNGDSKNDLSLNMEFSISKGSGTVQISTLVPEEVLYQDSHFQTVHSSVWLKHNEELAAEIAKTNARSVFEVGGGSGILECTYRRKFGKIKWTIMEPIADPIEGCEADYISGFFPQDIAKIENDIFFDCIVHSNSWEHMYRPVEFLKAVVSLMKIGDFSVFSIPNFKGQLTHFITSMMNFEHTLYLSEDYVDILLKAFGLKIVSKKYYGEHHSIFYTVQKIIKNLDESSLEKMTNNYNDTIYHFKNFFKYHEELVVRWNDRMNEMLSKNSSVKFFLFGAHISSQYYLSYGLDNSKISGIIDNNLDKQGKRLGGTDWIVKGPQILNDFEFPVVILGNSPYTKEIKEGLLSKNCKLSFIES